MDSEYLQHIESSPYISEALPSRMRAGASALGQRLRGMMGSEEPYQSLDYTRLMSRYNVFIADIRAILKEFVFGPTSPAERLQKMQNPPLTPQQQQVVNELTDLYNELSRGVFPPGTSPEMRKQISLKETIRENFATRKWAQGTNDANKILAAYVNDLKTVYENFSNDIKKMFPQLPNQSVEKIFSTKTNNKSATNSISNVATFLKYATPQVPPTQPPPTPPAQAPKQPAPQGGEQGSADDFIALIAEAVEVLNERIQRDTSHSAGYFAKPYGKGEFYLPKSLDEPSPTDIEWGHIPADINPDTETDPQKKAALAQKKAEMEKGGHYVKDPSTGEWKFILPKALQEALDEEDEDDDEGDDDSEVGNVRKLDTGNQEVEITGKFVYDFASLYKKYPGGFNIEATEGGGRKIQLPSGKVKVLRVFWNWKKRQNSIIVKTRDENNNIWIDGEILLFYDDQVNPHSPSYDFNFELFAEQVDERTSQFFKQASSAQLARLTEEAKVAKPAFYAIVRRKGVMEFKSKGKDPLGLFFPKGSTDPHSPNYGQVEIGRGKERGKILTQPELMVRYHSGDVEEQQIWKKALENLEYFEQIQGAKDKFDDLTLKITSAKHELIKKHPAANPQNIDELIGMATKKLGTKILTMSPEEIAAASVENVSPTTLNSPPTAYVTSTGTYDTGPEQLMVKDVPNAVEAVAALIELGMNKDKARNLIQTVLDSNGPDLSTRKYIKLALAKPKKNAPPATTTSTKPEEPEKEPPTQPTQSEPSLKDKKKGATHPIIIWKGSDGAIRWQNKFGNISSLTSKQLSKLKSNPEFIQALKTAQKNNFAPPEENLEESWVINPFQLSNFL